MEYTRFERARIIGARALQITMGAPILIDVPKEQLPAEVKAGDILNARGQPVKAVSVGEDTVKVDFNHILAGKDLTFKIKMIKIEK